MSTKPQKPEQDDKIQAYQQVVAILTSPDEIDFRALSIQVAKKYPDLFLRLLDEINPQPTEAAPTYMNPRAAWAQQCRNVRDLITGGDRVQSIKAMRELTGFGLKDAKEACDAIGEHIRSNGGSVAEFFSLPEETRELAKQILRA